MIYKNKNSHHSSIFGDSADRSKSSPVDESVLEGFFRKQTSQSPNDSQSGIVRDRIMRSSNCDNDSNPGEVFLGKDSSRSIFSPKDVNLESLPASKTIRDFGYLPNKKVEVSDEIADSLTKFKGNFNSASKVSGSHGSVRSDRISIFDNGDFERIIDNKKTEEVKKPEKKELSKSISSKDLTDSLFSKLSTQENAGKKTSREAAIDKLFGEKNG